MAERLRFWRKWEKKNREETQQSRILGKEKELSAEKQEEKVQGKPRSRDQGQEDMLSFRGEVPTTELKNTPKKGK